MGKHVCPVCEDVYAVKKVLTLTSQAPDAPSAARELPFEAWGCPHCGYEFLSVGDAETTLNQEAVPEGRRFKLASQWAGDPLVRLRFTSGILQGAHPAGSPHPASQGGV